MIGLIFISAVLAGVGTIDAGDWNQPHKLAMGLRGGASFLAGGSGSSYGAGPSLGFLIDAPFSDLAGFTVDIEYSSNKVTDASGFFSDYLYQPSKDVITGSQRHLSLDLGVRIGLIATDETKYTRSKVTVLPWFRLAVGSTLTITNLTVPAITGLEPIEAKRGHFTLVPGAGVTINFSQKYFLQPSFKGVFLPGIDHQEVTNGDSLGVTWKIQPSLDFLIAL